MAGKYYYLGKNGLEYATKDDADKHGGGCVGQRFHNPVKQWEPVYEEIESTEYDAMDLPQLKKVLQDKGYQIKGNLKRETIIEKLNSLKTL